MQSTSKPEHIILSGEDDRIQGVSAVYSMSTMSELYASLRKGYIDAAAGHEVAIKRFVDTNPQQFIILDEILYKSELGVAFKKTIYRKYQKQSYKCHSIYHLNAYLTFFYSSHLIIPHKYICVNSI